MLREAQERNEHMGKKNYSPDEIFERVIKEREAALEAGYDPERKAAAGDVRSARREAALKSGYTGKYAAMKDGLLDELLNRKPFSYNINLDPIYQQYRNRYTSLGQKAAEDMLGRAASLTGGYSNSYAESAAAQAYNEYLAELNGIVPELSKQAYAAYNDRGEQLSDRIALLQKLDSDEYSKYRDSARNGRYETDTESPKADPIAVFLGKLAEKEQMSENARKLLLAAFAGG